MFFCNCFALDCCLRRSFWYTSFHFCARRLRFICWTYVKATTARLFHGPFFLSVNIFIWLVNVSDYKVIKTQPIFTFVDDSVSIILILILIHKKEKQVLVLSVLDTRRTCRVKKAVVCVTELVTAFIAICGLCTFFADVYGLLDISDEVDITEWI